MPTIAERLQYLRGTKSRRSFAELLGIPPSTLKNYELGNTTPPVETLELVCEKLSVDRSWLLFGQGSMRASSDPIDMQELEMFQGKEVPASDSPVFQRLLFATGSVNDTNLAVALAVTPQAVSDARKKNKVPLGWALRAAQRYQVSLDWILLGKGDMSPKYLASSPPPDSITSARLIKAHAQFDEVQKSIDSLQPHKNFELIEHDQYAGLGLIRNGSRPQTIELPDTEIIMIPMVEARLSAGHGSFETDGEVRKRYAFRSDFLRRKGNTREMVLMRVEGDSMEPEVKNGDVVLIDQSQKDLMAGRIYAVGIEDMVFLKRLTQAVPGKITLASVNTAYPPLIIDTRGDLETGIRIVGRALWSCREL